MIGHCPGETVFAHSLLSGSADLHFLYGCRQCRYSAHSGFAPVPISGLCATFSYYNVNLLCKCSFYFEN